MIIGKFRIEDLSKMFKTIQLSKNPSTFNVQADGPKLLISYVDDNGKIVTVTLFSADINQMPTITKTDYL